MKLRIVGVIAAMFLGGAWAKAQAPMAPPAAMPAGPPAAAPMGPSPGASISGNPPYGAPGAVIYGAGPAPQFMAGTPAETTGTPVVPHEAYTGPGGGGQWWANADYLLWRIRSEGLPSTTAGTPAGVLLPLTTADVVQNTLGTIVSFTSQTQLSPVFIQQSSSGNSINSGDHNGFRFSTGYWFDPDRMCGVDASFFYVEPRGGTFTNASGFNPNQNLITTGGTSSLTVITPVNGNIVSMQTFPQLLLATTNASLTASTTNQLLGAELNTRYTCLRIGCLSFGGLVGFRYIDFREDLNVSENGTLALTTPTTVTGVPIPSVVPINVNLGLNTNDSIRTRNNFYAAQTGLDVGLDLGCFFLDLRGKVGLGVEHESVVLSGVTMFTLPTGNMTSPGGLLSGPGDIGNHGRDRIAYSGEVNLKVGYDVCHWLRLYVGYDGLFLSNVARPGAETGISTTNVNVTVAGTSNQVTLSQPSFHFGDVSLWAQGINFGVELRY